jgi:hypothetical protein
MILTKCSTNILRSGLFRNRSSISSWILCNPSFSKEQSWSFIVYPPLYLLDSDSDLFLGFVVYLCCSNFIRPVSSHRASGFIFFQSRNGFSIFRPDSNIFRYLCILYTAMYVEEPALNVTIFISSTNTLDVL